MKAPIAALVIALACTTAILLSSQQPKTETNSVSVQMAHRYQLWRQKFRKLSASPAELNFRLRVFAKTAQQVDRDNVEYAEFARKEGQQLTGPMFALQEHSDLTQAEIDSKLLGNIATEEPPRLNKAEDIKFSKKPAQQNGLQGGFITHVRNQGSCGSCYAHAVVAILEKHYYIEKNIQLEFSQQQIVDCSKAQHDNGCRGGLEPLTLNYIAQDGITLLSDYPYTASEGTCKMGSISKVIKFSYGESKWNDFSLQLAKNLHNAGQHPGVVVKGNGRFPHLSHTNDPFNPRFVGECGNPRNHAINQIGADDSTVTVLNSWGTSWGYQGTKKIIPCAANNLWGINGYIVWV